MGIVEEIFGDLNKAIFVLLSMVDMKRWNLCKGGGLSDKDVLQSVQNSLN